MFTLNPVFTGSLTEHLSRYSPPRPSSSSLTAAHTVVARADRLADQVLAILGFSGLCALLLWLVIRHRHRCERRREPGCRRGAPHDTREFDLVQLARRTRTRAAEPPEADDREPPARHGDAAFSRTR